MAPPGLLAVVGIVAVTGAGLALIAQEEPSQESAPVHDTEPPDPDPLDPLDPTPICNDHNATQDLCDFDGPLTWPAT
ncbi:MAG: hypothetical protein ACPHID_06730 [Thermoplasmatota archaeon]